MRFLMQVRIPVEKGNELAMEASIASTIQDILDELNPEAAYFTADDGERSCFIIFDMKEAHQIPAVAEPWFLAFNARVEISPVMLPEDLAKSETGIQDAVQRYRKTPSDDSPKRKI